MSSILYITYDGLLEPLGQSQVLAYLAELAQSHRIHVLSFEKKADRRDRPAMQAMRERLRRLEIGWTPLAYHKTPSAPATAYDVLAGMTVGLWLAVRNRTTIVHARSYVPALIALPIRRLTGSRFVFDMRGFWADERVDGALWPRDGLLYRVTKALEQRFLRASDHVVTLTRASARELRGFEAMQSNPVPISVIPTCADLSRFRRGSAGTGDGIVFGYVGSVGTWYLFEETLAFFRKLLERRPDARFLVVNRQEHALIRQLTESAGVPADRVEVVAAAHADVPRLIQRMHLGAALIKPAYSKIASAPTKLAEYLGCGVPCIGNAGVGDVEELLEGRRVGVLLRSFGETELRQAVDEALVLLHDPTLPARCAEAARDLFSLEQGVASYHRIYESLTVRA